MSQGKAEPIETPNISRFVVAGSMTVDKKGALTVWLNDSPSRVTVGAGFWTRVTPVGTIPQTNIESAIANSMDVSTGCGRRVCVIAAHPKGLAISYLMRDRQNPVVQDLLRGTTILELHTPLFQVRSGDELSMDDVKLLLGRKR